MALTEVYPRKSSFAFLVVLAAILVFAGCAGTPSGPQSFVGGNNVFYENGQAYIQTQAYLNAPLELYASNVPGFNGLKLDSGAYANATGKVTILVSQSKTEGVYPLVPRTGYVGGIFGFGAIRVTEYIPTNPTKNFPYDVSVNGNKVATGLSPFNVGEVSVNLPYNNPLAQTPVMKIDGQDAGSGAQQLPAASDFIIIRVDDTPEAQAANLVGAVRIYQQSIYYANKNNLFGANSGFVPLTYPKEGFSANTNTYTYPSPNIGSAYVVVKIPLGAFNIVTYRPPAAGQAQIVKQANGQDCIIQDAQASQQTNLQFTYKNIGENSVFSYSFGDGKYVYVSGDRSSGTQVAKGDSKTVNMRVTPNNDAKGTTVLPITITGESGITTQIACIGTVIQGTTPNPQPLPTPTPNPLPTTQCAQYFEKATFVTEGGFNFLGMNFGGTQAGKCVPDYTTIGIVMAIFGLLIFVLGFVMDKEETIMTLGGAIMAVGIGFIFLSVIIDNSAQIFIAGIGLGIIAIIGAVIYLKLKYV